MWLHDQVSPFGYIRIMDFVTKIYTQQENECPHTTYEDVNLQEEVSKFPFKINIIRKHEK